MVVDSLIVISLALIAVIFTVNTRIVDIITMVTVAEAELFVGDLKRLNDLDYRFVVGGCSELILDAAVTPRSRRVAELAVNVSRPRLPPKVAACRQLERTTQSGGTVGATAAAPLRCASLRRRRRRRVRRCQNIIGTRVVADTRRQVAARENRQKILLTFDVHTNIIDEPIINYYFRKKNFYFNEVCESRLIYCV